MAGQQRAQSKDFNEIRNTHTGTIKVKQEEWDKTFHNYNNPEECPGRKRNDGCTICEALIVQEKKGTEDEDKPETSRV